MQEPRKFSLRYIDKTMDICITEKVEQDDTIEASNIAITLCSLIEKAGYAVEHVLANAILFYDQAQTVSDPFAALVQAADAFLKNPDDVDSERH